MKELNLEEILDKNFNCIGRREWTLSEVLDMMKEACNQTVDLCVKNARIENNDGKRSNHFTTEDGYHFVICKESILKTKDQIK
jgi:hypothetical protein